MSVFTTKIEWQQSPRPPQHTPIRGAERDDFTVFPLIKATQACLSLPDTENCILSPICQFLEILR